jgi:hypothetical protein
VSRQVMGIGVVRAGEARSFTCEVMLHVPA